MQPLSKTLTFFLIVFSLLCMPQITRAEEFDMFIVPTVDDQLDSWLKTAPYKQPTIHMVENIYPQQPFALRILFKDYSISNLKNAYITYDVQFFDPAGKPTEDRGEALLGYNGPVKSKNYIIINQQFLRVFFDESYPHGDYEIQVTAKDTLNNTAIVKREKISLKPFKRAGTFSSFDFFSFWIKNYFRQPDAAKAIFGILQYLQNDLEWMQDNRSFLSFSTTLLEDNPWIWEHLADDYKENKQARKSIISLMALTSQQRADISQTFNRQDEAWYETVSQLQKTTSQPVERFWGEFFATGHLQPIAEIVSFLKPFALPELTGSKLLRNSTEERAFWSLVENGTEIPLVHSYCLQLLERGDLDQQNKIQLRLVLDVIQKSLAENDQDKSEEDKKTPLPLSR